jgi:hypothetical protein
VVMHLQVMPWIASRLVARPQAAEIKSITTRIPFLERITAPFGGGFFV